MVYPLVVYHGIPFSFASWYTVKLCIIVYRLVVYHGVPFSCVSWYTV